MTTSKPTREEVDTLCHVILTSDMPWDPTTLDSIYDFDTPTIEPRDKELGFVDSRMDDYGNLVYGSNMHNIERCIYSATRQANARLILPQEPNYEAMRPYLGWAPADIV